MDNPRIDEYGTKYWYNELGQLHREDGPAIECSNGDKFWYQNDKRYREDGPSCEWANGLKYWMNGFMLHRTDGPAKEFEGFHRPEYWVNGVQYNSLEEGLMNEALE